MTMSMGAEGMKRSRYEDDNESFPSRPAPIELALENLANYVASLEAMTNVFEKKLTPVLTPSVEVIPEASVTEAKREEAGAVTVCINDAAHRLQVVHRRLDRLIGRLEV